MIKYHKGKLIISIFAVLSFLSSIVYAENIKDINNEIYSKLRDRRCNMPLSQCNCPDAREMKAYIEALIEMDINKEDIFYKVAKKFSPNLILDKQIREAVEKRIIEESKGKRPQAALEPTSFDFGKVSKKLGKIHKIFKLHNKGNDVLIIRNLKASCPCVTISIKVGNNKSPYFDTSGAPAGWQVQIKPGKSAEIEAVIDLQHSTVNVGKLIREIYINTNELLNPEITLRVEAEVTD